MKEYISPGKWYVAYQREDEPHLHNILRLSDSLLIAHYNSIHSILTIIERMKIGKESLRDMLDLIEIIPVG